MKGNRSRTRRSGEQVGVEGSPPYFFVFVFLLFLLFVISSLFFFFTLFLSLLLNISFLLVLFLLFPLPLSSFYVSSSSPCTSSSLHYILPFPTPLSHHTPSPPPFLVLLQHLSLLFLTLLSSSFPSSSLYFPLSWLIILSYLLFSSSPTLQFFSTSSSFPLPPYSPLSISHRLLLFSASHPSHSFCSSPSHPPSSLLFSLTFPPLSLFPSSSQNPFLPFPSLSAFTSTSPLCLHRRLPLPLFSISASSFSFSFSSSLFSPPLPPLPLLPPSYPLSYLPPFLTFSSFSSLAFSYTSLLFHHPHPLFVLLIIILN